MESDPSIRFVETDGRRMRARVAGDGEPLLLVHGIGRTLEDWNAVWDALAISFRVIAVDLPGFGESDPIGGDVGLPALAQAVLDVVDALGERRPMAVAGNSLGGAVCLQLAALAPDRVRALILVDSAGFGSEVTPALRVLALPGVGKYALRSNRWTARMRLRGIFYDPQHATDEQVELLIRNSRRPGYAAAFVSTGKSLGTWRGIKPEWREQLLAELRERDLPVLAMWGERDRILPARHLEAARIAFPDGEFHLLPKTGHMPQIEQPGDFVTLVEGFLANLVDDGESPTS